MNNEEYWNKKIIEWEDSVGERGKLSLIEKIASYFRKPLKVRSEMTTNLLEKFAPDKTVAEMGCGSGFFAFQLYERCKFNNYIGMDIAKTAVQRAQQIAREKGLSYRFQFIEGDAASQALPQADITFCLGFLDYLTEPEIRSLFQNLKSRYFLFTFSKKNWSVMRMVHIVYLWTQHCSEHYYNTEEEIVSFIGERFGKITFVNDPRLGLGCIVHNMPTTYS